MAEQPSAAELLAAERAAALERLNGIRREWSGIIESASAGADDEHDPEGATLAFERQHLLALISQAREHVSQIDEALVRLAEGTYGRCAACGGAIGAARLVARPVTTTCIGCASRRGLLQRLAGQAVRLPAAKQPAHGGGE